MSLNKENLQSKSLIDSFIHRILSVQQQIDPSRFFAECLIYIALVIWGFSFFDDTNFAENPHGITVSFLHNVNLIFHEAGHWIFSFFGRFILVFGGTLMQCLIPFIIMIQFLRQKDNFEATIGLWWFGENFLDVAPYIYDAWDKKLPLLGGGTGQDRPDTHDWYYLLRATDSLNNYAEIAGFVANMGKLILMLSFLWGGVILYKKFLQLRANGFKKIQKI